MNNKLEEILYKKYSKKGYKKQYLFLRVDEKLKEIKMSAVALLVFILMLIGILLFVLNSSHIKNDVIFDGYFDKEAEIFTQNPIVVSIATTCKNFDKEEDKIRCVNNFVKEFYYYDTHDSEIAIIRTPKQIINRGGCCRDYSIFTKAIFSLMGFDSEFLYAPNHIYLEVFGEEHNYIVDQKKLLIR